MPIFLVSPIFVERTPNEQEWEHNQRILLISKQKHRRIGDLIRDRWGEKENYSCISFRKRSMKNPPFIYVKPEIGQGETRHNLQFERCKF